MDNRICVNWTKGHASHALVCSGSDKNGVFKEPEPDDVQIQWIRDSEKSRHEQNKPLKTSFFYGGTYMRVTRIDPLNPSIESVEFQKGDATRRCPLSPNCTKGNKMWDEGKEEHLSLDTFVIAQVVPSSTMIVARLAGNIRKTYLVINSY